MSAFRFILFLIIICCGVSCGNSNESTDDNTENSEEADGVYMKSIHTQAEKLTQYITNNQAKRYNSDIAFMINFKRASGEYRFFVYDLKNKKILNQGLVTHGSGSEQEGKKALIFSNTPNSLSTSLGKYKMGHSYMGEFGKAYKMYGLDASNSRAFERFIVFHAHKCVPDFPVRNEICVSWGCPTVSPDFFTTIADYIDNSDRSILMEIFYL